MDTHDAPTPPETPKATPPPADAPATNTPTKKPVVSGKTALTFSAISLPLIHLSLLGWAALFIGIIMGLAALKFDPAGRKYAKWAIALAIGICIALVLYSLAISAMLQGH